MNATTEPPEAVSLHAAQPVHGVSLAEALRVWLRLFCLVSAARTGRIAGMPRMVVEAQQLALENAL
jgi:hypothetical protein